MYGNTAEAANNLAILLAQKGLKNIKIYDISQTDETYLISEVFRVSHIVLMCPTYNLGLYPKMSSLLATMQKLNVQKRTFALVENGTWGPLANKIMTEEVNKLKNVKILDKKITIRSSLNKQNELDLGNLAEEIVNSIK